MNGPDAKNADNERQELMAELTRKTAFNLDAPTLWAYIWLSDLEKLRNLAELEPEDLYDILNAFWNRKLVQQCMFTIFW